MVSGYKYHLRLHNIIYYLHFYDKNGLCDNTVMLYFKHEVFCCLAKQIHVHIHVMLESNSILMRPQKHLHLTRMCKQESPCQ